MIEIIAKKQRFINRAMYITFTILLLIIYFISPRNEFFANKDESVSGWSYQIDKNEGTLVASHKLNDELKGKTICFYTDDSFVDAYIEDDNIYHFGKENNMGTSPGSFYHFIEIPKTVENDEILIKINTVFPNSFKSSYDFEINTKSALILEKVQNEFLGTFLNFIILVAGLVIIIISFIEKKNTIKNKSSIYLGVTTIMYASWSCTFSFTSYLLLKNSLFIHYLNYFSLFFFSIALVCYIENTIDEVKLKKEYYTLVVTISILTILHILRILEYTESEKIFMLIFIIVSLIATIKVVKTIRKEKKDLSEIVILFLMALILINSGFLLFDNKSLLEITRICASLLAGVNIYLAVKELMNEFSLIQEAKTLKEIAYKDNLTKIANRYALDSDLKEIDIKDICFVSLDLNNLKYYNDNFGHSYGDKLIKEASKILEKTYGNVYRVGGDEFLVLLKNKSLEELFELKQEMRQNIDTYNKNHIGIILEIASGCSVYNENDKTYEDILKRADDEMYKDKKYLKSMKK